MTGILRRVRQREIRHSEENIHTDTQRGRPGEDRGRLDFMHSKPRNTKDLVWQPQETNKATMAPICQVFSPPPLSPCPDGKHSEYLGCKVSYINIEVPFPVGLVIIRK